MLVTVTMARVIMPMVFAFIAIALCCSLWLQRYSMMTSMAVTTLTRPMITDIDGDDDGDDADLSDCDCYDNETGLHRQDLLTKKHLFQVIRGHGECSAESLRGSCLGCRLQFIHG